MGESEKKFWLGFDLGGTKMMASVFGPDYQILSQKRKRTKAQIGAENGFERMQTTIREALSEAGIKASQLAGIGVGCPGPVDPDEGIIYKLTNLGWENLKIKALMEKAFSCPVVIANDVDAGVFGEYVFGAAKGARSVLGVFPGTGIGGGFVYKGEIVSGKGISCFEVGHICVQPGGALCGCGRRGCLETIASRLAISAAAAAAAYRGEAPALLKLAGTDISKIRSGVLAESIKAGDTSIEGIVVNAGEWLGIGIGAAINMLAPEVVVLGGGLMEALPDLIMKAVQRTVKVSIMSPFESRFRIEIAKLGDDAVVKGVAAWARKTILGSVS